MVRPRIHGTDVLDVIPFRKIWPEPVDTISAVALIPEAGIWDLAAEVWAEGTVPDGPYFVYVPTGLAVTWTLVNRVTGQRLALQPGHVPGIAAAVEH